MSNTNVQYASTSIKCGHIKRPTKCCHIDDDDDDDSDSAT